MEKEGNPNPTGKKMMMMSPNSEKCSRLCSIQTSMVSIESAKLKITSGNRERRIYGDIHVNRGHLGKAYSIYHRTSDEAETVSSQRWLTLRGPRHGVHLPEIIYVDLHEAGVEGGAPLPFLRTAFELKPVLQQHRGYNVSFDIPVVGDNGTLTVFMTRVAPSVLTMIQVDLLDVLNPCDTEWLVSGTVTAIQTLPGAPPIKRKLTLLNRPESDPIHMTNVPVVHLVLPYQTPSQVIPLDRKFVPAPVRLGSDYVTKMNSLIRESGGNPDSNPSHSNGEGSSLTVALNLKLKRPRLRCCVMAESREFELLGSHEVGAVYYDYIEAHVRIADKRRSRQRRIDQKIKIKVMLHTLNDMLLDKDDDVLESTLPLYVKEDEDEKLARLIAMYEPHGLAEKHAKKLPEE